MNYFKFFGINVKYEMDELQLIKLYFEKQKKIHPDISNESDDSSTANMAYKTLLHPISRAEHFLQLKNIDVEAVSSYCAEKMFKIREEYASLKNDEQIGEYKKYLKKQICEIIKLLPKIEEDLELFKEQFYLLKFLDSFLEKVKNDDTRRD